MKRLAGLALFISLFSYSTVVAQPQDGIEQWRGKTVMVFTPHPDDDLFGCGGTLALLARNGNKIVIVIYTNDNKGSFDLEMTSERLARIRKAEEEAGADNDWVYGALKARILHSPFWILHSISKASCRRTYFEKE